MDMEPEDVHFTCTMLPATSCDDQCDWYAAQLIFLLLKLKLSVTNLHRIMALFMYDFFNL